MLSKLCCRFVEQNGHDEVNHEDQNLSSVGEPCCAKGVYIPETGTYQIQYSARAGGGYVIAEDLLNSQTLALPDEVKARLTSWMVDQRLFGVAAPRITGTTVVDSIRRQPLQTYERASRLLRFLAIKSPTVSADVWLVDAKDQDDTAGQKLSEAKAWTESTNESDVTYLADYLQQRGWVQRTLSADMYRVTVDGHQEIAQDQVNVSSVPSLCGDVVRSTDGSSLRPRDRTCYRGFRLRTKEDR